MKKLQRLKELILQHVQPDKILVDLLGENIADFSDGDELQIFCPMHNSDWDKPESGKSRSFSLNKQSLFNCFSEACNARGRNIVQFTEQFFKKSYEKTLRWLYHNYVRPTIPTRKLKAWHETLLDSPSVLKYLKRKRGLKKETLRRFMLGFDGDRITIPVFNEFGMCINVRRYSFSSHTRQKMISYKGKNPKRRYGGIYLFPVDNLVRQKTNSVLVCEGEWDCLLANQLGYNAVTATSGAGKWPEGLDSLFSGKVVRIVYDVNDVSQGKKSHVGQLGAQKIAERLSAQARSIKIVELPLDKEGGDLSDYFLEAEYSKKDFKELVEGTKYFSKSNAVKQVSSKWLKVPLDRASEAKLARTPIEMDCMVVGKDLSPYFVPRKVKVKWGGSDETEIVTIPLRGDERTLRFIGCSAEGLEIALRRFLGIGPRAEVEFEVLTQATVEEIWIAPAMNFQDTEEKYVLRRAYHLGHGIETNRMYRMKGYTYAHPANQKAVHFIEEAEPIHDAIETFAPTDTIGKSLSERFGRKRDGLEASIFAIEDWLSRNITKIRQRPDLHLAVDLVFHSPLSFYFNGEYVHKGWLEAIIIGDTRCGKGYVAERLSRFYRMGEVVSGENSTFAGLVGGVQQTDGKRWILSWGKIPLNDRRLVIIDEASAMHIETIGRMSRLRSEGIAEVVKIISEKTRARTRLLWLSNARSGKPMNTYNHGVETLLELMGSTEDVSRFDFALTVASSEVPSRVINAPPVNTKDGDEYSAEDFQNLIRWTWSRKPEQVHFTQKATRLILKLAIEMGKRYSSTVPLVQAENMRIKLAKISAAIAARVFSTDESYQNLVIKNIHVKMAHEFLRSIYSKPSMAYDLFSDSDKERSELRNEDLVEKLIMSIGRYSLHLVEGFLDQKEVTVEDVADFISKDRFEAKELVGKLVRLRCIVRERGYYVKRSPFIHLLRQLRGRLRNE